MKLSDLAKKVKEIPEVRIPVSGMYTLYGDWDDNDSVEDKIKKIRYAQAEMLVYTTELVKAYNNLRDILFDLDI